MTNKHAELIKRLEFIAKHGANAHTRDVARQAADALQAITVDRDEWKSALEASQRLAAGYMEKLQASESAAVPVAYTTGHCKEHGKAGGCQLHNLQCGYPGCDRKAVSAAPQPPAPVKLLPLTDEREFPLMTPELKAILGTMCFQCIGHANMLRASGQSIKDRAEDEQAAVLHWMLSFWFKHGEDWREAAKKEVVRMKEAYVKEQP